MIKNTIKYFNDNEYLEFIDDIELRRFGECTGKNIYITHAYNNVELVNFLFKELEIDREILEKYETNYDILYDMLKEIPERVGKGVRFINLILESKNYIDTRMFKILEYIQEYFAEEIIECGAEDSFPLSFDIYIKS